MFAFSEADSMALRKDYVMRKQQAAEARAQAAAQRQAEREKMCEQAGPLGHVYQTYNGSGIVPAGMRCVGCGKPQPVAIYPDVA